MPSGLIFGLGAALAWGLTDITAALGGRRYGSLRAVVATQAIGVSTLLLGQVAVVLAGGALPALDGGSVAVAALCGIVASIAYLAFFTALRIGPISVVSPTVAAYGGLTVVLAVIVRGEALTGLQALGAFVGTLGVVLVALTFDGGDGRRSVRVGPGVLFAVVALVAFAGLTIVMADPIRAIGWLPTLIVSRATNAAFGAGLLTFALVRPRSWAEPFLTGRDADPAGRRLRSPATAVVLAGLLDVTGLALYGVGLETSLVWLVGLASSFGPVAAVLVAVLALGERPRPIQWLGLVAIGAGIALIGLDRAG